MTGVYVIILNEGKDIFDIYHCAFLKQRYFRKHDFLVVGLADSHESAVSMTTGLIAGYYQKTGNTDIKTIYQKYK